jgi:DNA-directed RNA polymerase specialized sigma24 family protein
MATSAPLISAVAGYVEATSRHLSGLGAFARWSESEPRLHLYRNLAEVVRACRGAPPAEQDALLGALLAVAGDDPLAQLAVIAALSRRLASAVSSWRRAGASHADLAALQADLVSECWVAVVALATALAAGQPLPPRVGLVLVDQAKAAVRAPRRRQLRAAGLHVSLDHLGDQCAEDRSGPAEELAREIGAAVRAGRISASAARPVFLTRVAGYSTAEAARALGHSPAVLRAARSRAERVLVA